MKEIFEIKRFWALTVKFYRENMKTHLIFAAIMAVVTYLCVCKFNPFHVEYSYVPDAASKAEFISHRQAIYGMVCWGLFWIFSIFAAGRAFRDVMSRSKAIGALLLPASSFEKFLLVFLHSVAFVFLVNLAIFYASATIANTYKYAGLEQMSFKDKDLFGNSIPFLQSGEEVVHPKVGNVFNKDLVAKTIFALGGSSKLGTIHFFKLFLIAWSILMLMFLWGAITFRKYPMLLVVLVHFGFLILLGIILWLCRDFLIHGQTTNLYWLTFYNDTVPLEWPSEKWLLLLYAFPVTYLLVTWRKFKNKQI